MGLVVPEIEVALYEHMFRIRRPDGEIGPFHSIDHDPGPARGDFYVLTKEWGAQGASVRLKSRVKPVYVSPGHLVDLPSALALALVWSTGRHRVPEPLSAAHTLSREARNG